MGFFSDMREFWKKYGWHIILGTLAFIFLVLFIINHFQYHERTTNVSMQDIYEHALRLMFQPHSSTGNYRRRHQQTIMSKGEARCKEFSEFFFQKPFDKERPDFLKNPVTGENLELDLYNRDLKLAIEYNGAQHYKYNAFMHKNSKERFYNQQYRDILKKDMCDKSGIQLVVVPYTVPEDQISHFLFQEFKKMGFEPSSSAAYA